MFLIRNNYGFKFLKECESHKIALSDYPQTTVDINWKDKVTINEIIKRSEFKKNIVDKNQMIDDVLKRILKSAGLNSADITLVTKTGGSSEIPSVNAVLQNKFGADKILTSDIFSSISNGLAKVAYQKYS